MSFRHQGELSFVFFHKNEFNNSNIHVFPSRMILGIRSLLCQKKKLEIETNVKFECEGIQTTQNSIVFAFVLKNILTDHGNVKTPARWFSEQRK